VSDADIDRAAISEICRYSTKTEQADWQLGEPVGSRSMFEVSGRMEPK
jgi:hypothetical protein